MTRMPCFAAISTIGMTPAISRSLSPDISPPSTAGICGHLIAVANACKEWRRSPMTAASRRAGIADALALTAEHAVDLRVGRRTQTVTPRQLEDLLAAIARTLASAPLSEDKLATQLSELAVEARPWSTSRAQSPSSGAMEADRISCIGRARPWQLSRRIARIIRIRLGRPLLARRGCLSWRTPSRDGDGDGLSPSLHRLRQSLSIGFLISESALDPNCVMTSWRQRHDWRASSRSPKAICRPGTGSGSAAPRRRSGAARR